MSNKILKVWFDPETEEASFQFQGGIDLWNAREFKAYSRTHRYLKSIEKLISRFNSGHDGPISRVWEVVASSALPAPKVRLTHKPRPDLQPAYTVNRDEYGRLCITCGTCKMTSWNPSDVENAYCGNCHIFHLGE